MEKVTVPQTDGYDTRLDISVVVPCYKSDSSLPGLVEEVFVALSKADVDGEVILVDDDSGEEYEELLRSISVRYAKVKLISLRKNMGQHFATAVGCLAASKQLIVTIDDDGQNPPGEILGLAKQVLTRRLDIVYGIPRDKKQTARRKFVAILFRKIVAWISGQKLFEKQSNFRAFRRNLLGGLPVDEFLSTSLDTVLLSRTSRVGSLGVIHNNSTQLSSRYRTKSLMRLAKEIAVSNSSRILQKTTLVIGAFSVVFFVVATVTLFVTLGNPDRAPGIVLLGTLVLGVGGILGLLNSMVALYTSFRGWASVRWRVPEIRNFVD